MRTMLAGLLVLGMTVLAVAPATAQETTATTGAGSIAITVGYIDFGVTTDPNDDCAYLKMSNAGTATISPGDIRILKSNTLDSICNIPARAPGTIVTANDPAETGAGSAVKLLTMTLKYEDQNGNGRYDANDTLFLDTRSSGALSATNSGAGVYAIRLGSIADPSFGTLPAGSLVFASHRDYYGGGPSAQPLTSASVTWLERNGNAAFDGSDYGYILPQNGPGFAAASTIPLGGLRVTANNPNGPFGSTVKVLGAAGAPTPPTLTITSATPTVGDYTMTVSYTNFILDPVTTTPANAAGHGHIQYFRNGAKCDGACAAGAAYETNAPLFAFHGLVAGDKISAELVNNNNTSLTPVVKQEITVPSAASSSTLTTTPTTVTTTVRITRSHSSSGTIPAVGPVLIVALVAAVFLTRRKL